MQKLLSFFLLFVAACTSHTKEVVKEPENLLPQAKMVAILTDMQASEGVMAIKLGGNLNTRTQQKNAYQVAILKKYGISQPNFWESYEYYSDNPKLLDTIYAQVVKELEKEMPAEKERMAKNPPVVPPAPTPVMAPKPQILPPLSGNKGGKTQ